MSSPETPLPPTPTSNNLDYNYYQSRFGLENSKNFSASKPFSYDAEVGNDVTLFNQVQDSLPGLEDSQVSPTVSLFPRIKSYRPSPELSGSQSPSQLESNGGSAAFPTATHSVPSFATVDSSDEFWGYKRKRTTSFEAEELQLIEEDEMDQIEDNRRPSDSNLVGGFQASAPKKSKVLSLEAPTQQRNYITPSSTSKKPIPAYAQVQYHKWLASQQTTAARFPVDESIDNSMIPKKIKENIEHRRRQNALSARRTRMKKAGRVQELEGTIEKLNDEVKSYERHCKHLLWKLEQLKKDSSNADR